MRSRIHYNIYIALLILMAVSIPLSKFTLSSSQLLLAINWLVEGNFNRKFRKLKEKKQLIYFLGVYFVFVLWLFNTQNLNWGLQELKEKLPLLSLPLIVGTSAPISKKHFTWILLAFTSSVSYASIVSTFIYTDIIHKNISDIRHISLYTSHIRLALMVVLSCFILWNLKNEQNKMLLKWVMILNAVWLLIFLFILNSLTGIVILLSVFYLLSLRYVLIKKKRFLKITGTLILLIIPIGIGLYIYNSYQRFNTLEYYNRNTLPKKTINGNIYFHDFSNHQVENGKYVGLYICDYELRKEWNKISNYKYDSLDQKGQEIKYTLIRYLTSKGERKDSLGILSLDSTDIKTVESGVANYKYLRKYDPYMYLYKIFWQIRMYQFANKAKGHSITQRFEYLKTAVEIIRNNILFGVGTGDTESAFQNQYKTDNSNLPDNIRYKSHNQYVTLLVTTGIVGFLLISFLIAIFLIKSKKLKLFLPFVFTTILLLSMINEDTLETQTGLSFAAFFTTMFFIIDTKRE